MLDIVHVFQHLGSVPLPCEPGKIDLCAAMCAAMAQRLLVHVAMGLRKLHELGYIYNDLKPGNIGALGDKMEQLSFVGAIVVLFMHKHDRSPGIITRGLWICVKET